MNGEKKIFSGNANPALAKEICEYVGIPLGQAEVSKFSDGEIFVQINDNVRGADVFVIQPTCYPVNDNLMELLIMIDALKRASASRITAVLPYYGYARQDRKVQPRVPITAKLVADLITAAGAQRVLAVDFHAGQIQGFFNIPVDHLFASVVLVKYFEQLGNENAVVVAPDAGGVERARAFANRIKTSIAIIDKRRVGINQAKVLNVMGEVKGKDLIIVDDMIDTAGTLIEAVNLLQERGARKIYACCTHGVLSGPALERINNSSLHEVVITNTIPLPQDKDTHKIKVISVAPLLGETIRRIHRGESVSSLFN